MSYEKNKIIPTNTNVVPGTSHCIIRLCFLIGLMDREMIIPSSQSCVTTWKGMFEHPKHPLPFPGFAPEFKRLCNDFACVEGQKQFLNYI